MIPWRKDASGIAGQVLVFLDVDTLRTLAILSHSDKRGSATLSSSGNTLILGQHTDNAAELVFWDVPPAPSLAVFASIVLVELTFAALVWLTYRSVKKARPQAALDNRTQNP